MNPNQLKILADLFGQDLSGWQISECHLLELDHGLMGNFPAIDQDKEVIATLDKSALEMVWKKLERRPAKVTSLLVIAHPEHGIAFNLENPYRKHETEPLRILSAERINELCQGEGSVMWTPGLIQLTERRVHDPVFT